MDKMIKNLILTDSVAGNEENILNYIIENIKNYCDEYYIDNLGNLIVHLEGKGEKIMLNTPVSEDGIFITHIEENGALRFAAIGDINAKDLINRKVKLINSDIFGIVYKDQSAKDEDLKIQDLKIDIGYFSKSDCEKKVKIGDVFYLIPDYLTINENIYSYSLSKKLGIYILIETIKSLYKKTESDLYFAFTIEDNLGFKGAKIAANIIKPDYAFIISCTDISNKNSEMSLKCGPALRIKDSFVITNRTLRDSVIKKLSENEIPYQLEIVTKGGLYNNEIMYLNNGILTVNLNIPIKDINSYYECANKKDIEYMLKGLITIINSFKEVK